MQSYKYIILPVLLAGMLTSLPLIGNTDSSKPKQTYFSKIKDRIISGYDRIDRILFSQRMGRALDRITSGLMIIICGQFAYSGYKGIIRNYKQKIK